MKTIAGGVSVMICAAIMYPFWSDTAVLGPLWSSLVMGGIGLSIVISGTLFSLKRK